uniref:Uncharacterized protein n=1 Tax=Bos mutus grunniens TaxID=30521 RepID=A0A8C0A666_BOSMU
RAPRTRSAHGEGDASALVPLTSPPSWLSSGCRISFCWGGGSVRRCSGYIRSATPPPSSPPVHGLHVVADELDTGRVQLLLAQGAAAVVLLAQVLVGEELREQVHQQARGKVADGQAALVDAAQLLLAQQAVGARHLEVGLRDLQLVEVDGHQPDLLGPPAGPLALKAVFYLDHGDVIGQAG